MGVSSQNPAEVLSCVLAILQGVRALPFKGKMSLRVWMEVITGKKCIFEVQNRELTGCSWHWVRRLYGFDTSGWTGMTASLPAPKSCTNRHSLLDFWMGRMGVLQGDWQDLNSPCCRNFLTQWLDPLRASGFKRYLSLSVVSFPRS